MVAAVRASTRSGQSDVLQASNSTAVPTNQVGDKVYLCSESWSNTITPTITWPSGFTQIFNQSVSDGSGGTVFLRIAEKEISSVDSGSYSITLSGTAWNQLMAISCSGLLTGASSAEDNDFATGASATSVPSVTSATVTDADLILHVIATFNAVTSTPPTNYTESIEGDVLHINYRVLSGAGSETSSGGVLSGSTPKVVAQLALKPAASGATNLVIQDSLHASVADQFGVTQNHLLIIQDSTHAHTSDVVNFNQVHQIAIFDAVHTTLADNLVLAGGTTLIIQDATHAHSADGLVLVQTHNLIVQDATHQTKSDTISLVPPGTGGFMTVSDVQVQKLAVITGKTGSIQDLQFAYYSSLSGLVPASSFSVADHQRAYWEAQTGLTGKSLADLEKAFYDVQLIAAGSLSDREFTYWTNV